MTSAPFVNVAAGSAQPQTTFPYRAGYQPPDRGNPGSTITPLQLGTWTTDSGDPATDADGFIRAAELAFRKRLASLDPGSYSTQGLRDRIAAFADGPEMKLVDAAQQSVVDAADAADDAADSVRAGLSPTGDTAAELRATRYWTRTARLLDSITDGGSLVAKAQSIVAEATPEELGTLLDELAPYLESRGADTSWADAAVAQSAPDLANALAAQSLAHKAVTVTKANADKLRQTVATTASPNAYGNGQQNALRDGLRFVPLTAIK